MLGSRIAALRMKMGWSQAELARRLHISPSAVGMYEQGRREPPAQTLVKLARIFSVSTEYLLTGKNVPKEALLTDLGIPVKLLSREELLVLLHSEEVRDYPWISDENQRKLRFRELISSGDRAQLMGMIGALHRHRREQIAAGRKFHQSDENFLHDAQKLLNAEFAQVFGLKPGDVGGFILRELENTH